MLCLVFLPSLADHISSSLPNYSRLLDLLLDINNSSQIPGNKRFDLSLDPPSDPNGLRLDIDNADRPPHQGPQPAQSLRQLLGEGTRIWTMRPRPPPAATPSS